MSYFGSLVDPRSGLPATVSLDGAVLTGPMTPLAGGFINPGAAGAVDPSVWLSTSTGTGATVTAWPGLCVMSSGTVAAGYTMLSSVAPARYVGGSTCRYHGIVGILAGGVADEKEIHVWGATNLPESFGMGAAYPYKFYGGGFYFVLVNRVLSIVARFDSTHYAQEASGGFSGEVPEYVIDGNSHEWEILYNGRSASYYVDGTLLGTLTLENAVMTSDASYVADQSLRPTALVFNNADLSGFAGENSMEVYSQSILRVGHLYGAPIWKRISSTTPTGIAKYGPGALRRVVNDGGVGSLSLYDAITATNPIATIVLPRIPGALDLNIEFYTGLYYSLSGQGAATIVYE